jgi:hypothetical protein
MLQELPVDLRKQLDDLNNLYKMLTSKVTLTNRTIRETTKVINQLEYISNTLVTHVLENQTNANGSNGGQEGKDRLKELIVDLKRNVGNLRMAVDLLEI